MRHREASIVLEEIYSQYANGKQKAQLIEEFYGPEFSVFKAHEGTKSLKELLQDDPSRTQPIMKYLSENLRWILDKSGANIGQQTIIHRAILEFLQNDTHISNSSLDILRALDEKPQVLPITTKGVAEMVDILKDHLVTMLHTRDGARVTQLCLLHGTTKERKHIIKILKEFAPKIAKEQYGHTVLLTLFECVDDTVLVQKSIVGTLLDCSEKTLSKTQAEGTDPVSLLKDKYASKVILHLLCGRNRKYHPGFVVNELEEIDFIRAKTSKKDDLLKTAELLKFTAPLLAKIVLANTQDLIRDKNASQVINELLWNMNFSDETSLILSTIASLTIGTVEDYEILLQRAETEKQRISLGETFHAVKKLKVQLDAEKKEKQKKSKKQIGVVPQKESADEDEDTDDEFIVKKKACTEETEGEAEFEHVLVNRNSTFFLKNLISANRFSRNSTESEDNSAQVKIAVIFSEYLVDAISPNVMYWINRCISDPIRTNGVAFVLLALLECELKTENNKVISVMIAQKVEEGLLQNDVTFQLEAALQKVRKEQQTNGKEAKKRRRSDKVDVEMTDIQKERVIGIEEVFKRYKAIKRK
ncbi:hypothetical protein HK096_003434 [Nowakowskiella sp. JEL0078]|nr:hypothetical protein HK096_003434 [Nowakowskiella sp. JEL0078]